MSGKLKSDKELAVSKYMTDTEARTALEQRVLQGHVRKFHDVFLFLPADAPASDISQ